MAGASLFSMCSQGFCKSVSASLISTNNKPGERILLGESALPLVTAIKYWVADFKRDRRNDRPHELIIVEKVKKIEEEILDDRGLKVRELADISLHIDQEIC